MAVSTMRAPPPRQDRSARFKLTGYRHAGDVGGLEGDPKLGDSSDWLAVGQEVCDHGDPCGCCVEGYADGRAEAEHRPVSMAVGSWAAGAE